MGDGAIRYSDTGVGPYCKSSRFTVEVSVLSATRYEDLPDSARQRMGLAEGQQNVLVRVVLRDLDRTLTAAEANLLRDRIYAGLHQGSVHEWAAR